MSRLILFVALALSLTGCAGLATPAPSPTEPRTPQPSPTIAPALTSTHIFLTTSTLAAPSATPTSEGPTAVKLSCRVRSQSVRNGHHFSPREHFAIGWKVSNDGMATWDPASIDFAYFSGTKMYQYSPTQLPMSVDPHAAPVVLSADMVAPRNPGSYTTVWTLRQGTEDFCHVSLSIVVP